MLVREPPDNIYRIVVGLEPNSLNHPRVYVDVEYEVLLVVCSFGRGGLRVPLQPLMRFSDRFLLRFTILLVVFDVLRIPSLHEFVRKFPLLPSRTHSLDCQIEVLYRLRVFVIFLRYAVSLRCLFIFE